MNLKFKRMTDTAKTPFRGSDCAAGFDLYVDSIEKKDNNTVIYGSGISVEIPDGYVGILVPRSSVYKNNQIMANSIGVIDSDYRGEVKGIFDVLEGGSEYNIGDRYAQLIVMKYEDLQFEEVDTLSPTNRGEGGLGSTGK